jgi:hypothetical protein
MILRPLAMLPKIVNGIKLTSVLKFVHKIKPFAQTTVWIFKNLNLWSAE